MNYYVVIADGSKLTYGRKENECRPFSYQSNSFCGVIRHERQQNGLRREWSKGGGQ
jgi:hypothetical protein